ncbi:30S ribosomal protein S9 [Candidatus Microgenomates bacterium]|nr:30S ribosomal protein S9 [Candidatus Microgenomates bacterium]
MSKDHYYGLGRRKEATATAQLVPGKGQIIVNDRPAKSHFGHESFIKRILEPLAALQKESSFDISLRVRGGGKSGQADAARLAIAKAVTTLSEDLRPTLKKAGLLKRDSRVKERKKYGLKRARKAPQFTKR